MRTHAPTHTVRAYFVFTSLRRYEFDMSITFWGLFLELCKYFCHLREFETHLNEGVRGQVDGWVGKLLPGALPALLKVFNCLLLFH